MFIVNNETHIKDFHEAILIGLYAKNQKPTGLTKELDTLLDGYITELLKEGDISPKLHTVSKVHTLGKAPIKGIYFIGLWSSGKQSFDSLREAFGKAVKTLSDAKVESFALELDSFVTEGLDEQDVAHAFGEALSLSTYKFANYKQKPNETEKRIEEVIVYTNGDVEEIQASLTVGYAYGQGTNSARTLVNLPGNMLTATDLANYAIELGTKYGFEVEILEKEDMEKLGMGALLAVNKGSVEPPKMIVLKYQGRNEWEDVIGLVGKGITFDTGGYSIKPKDGIVGMKSDMGGAAAVLGAMEIIGELRPEKNVVAVIPSTDNMISGNAFKPDDVVTSMNGKTIEILNTDAEGRLALADGITYAKFHGASYLVD